MVPPQTARRRRRLAAWKLRVARQRERALALAARFEEKVPVTSELMRRLVNTNLLDSATRLAAQAFLTTVPLLFAFAAFAPASVRQELSASVQSLFGLRGNSLTQVQQVLATTHAATGSNTTGADELRQTTGIIGLLMALLSATSFSRAMARVCQSAWQLPKASTRISAWRWLVWLLALLLVVLFQGRVRTGFGAGFWLGIPLSFLLSTAVWWWTQHLLLAARVRWLPLLPGAVLAGVALTVLSLASRVYMPAALNRSLASYGSFGLVLTLLSWLIVLCVAVTFAVVIGAVLAEYPPVAHYLGPRTGPAPEDGEATDVRPP